jgi:ceramide glucosyltransferase
MNLTEARYLLLAVAAIPFIYYLMALFSSVRFFQVARKLTIRNSSYTPPVSCLKPVKGLDPEAYENFASYCRQDYPDYEIVFCVDQSDPAFAVIEKLIRDFPGRRIRVLFGPGHQAINDKVARLTRLVNEAQHEVVVINDADVRVAPDYLRTVVAPLADPSVGGTTCFYASIHENTLPEKLQSVGMISDFFPGILVAWRLDGVKFALGQTIATTRTRLTGFGGYQALENRPADDLLVGRFIAAQGCEMRFLPYVLETVSDFQSFHDLIHKRLRWMTEMRFMRPRGHFGLIFTQGLAWSLIAVAAHPSAAMALAYFGTYLALRAAMAVTVGSWGLKQKGIWKKLPLIPCWDAMALFVWLASFARRSMHWRGADYHIRKGTLVPTAPPPTEKQSSQPYPRHEH